VEELVHTDLTWRQDLWQKEDNEIKTEMQSELQPIIQNSVGQINEDNVQKNW
jgi:hypothetical protein